MTAPSDAHIPSFSSIFACNNVIYICDVYDFYPFQLCIFASSCGHIMVFYSYRFNYRSFFVCLIIFLNRLFGNFGSRWAHPGKQVYITGTFDNWSLSVPMRRATIDGEEFEATVPVDRSARVEFKFVVDGVWRCGN